MDDRLRQLERACRTTGAVEDEAAWLRERARVGDVTRDRLELAAFAGHGAARAALGLERAASDRLPSRLFAAGVEVRLAAFTGDHGATAHTLDAEATLIFPLGAQLSSRTWPRRRALEELLAIAGRRALIDVRGLKKPLDSRCLADLARLGDALAGEGRRLSIVAPRKGRTLTRLLEIDDVVGTSATPELALAEPLTGPARAIDWRVQIARWGPRACVAFALGAHAGDGDEAPTLVRAIRAWLEDPSPVSAWEVGKVDDEHRRAVEGHDWQTPLHVAAEAATYGASQLWSALPGFPQDEARGRAALIAWALASR